MYYDAKEFGMRLKEIRKANKMTQVQLAEKLCLSVDSISNIENGRAACMPDHLTKICQIFNISADYFYFGIKKSLCDDKLDNGIMELLKDKNEFEKNKALKMLKLLFEK